MGEGGVQGRPKYDPEILDQSLMGALKLKNHKVQ